MAIDLILGTAGHIDHGKTSLVTALTGTDTDRLPEEKRRGITIDLGFALLELPPYRLGIVDCPGHERFIRNMLAGTTGIDLVLLVVAADDSVKQQSREHLDIVAQLDLRGGVIALTKCDLVDEQRLSEVEQSIRLLTQHSPLADAAIVRTSVVSGAGLDQLHAALHAAAEKAGSTVPAVHGAPFRMAIDRSFALAGHGTVVTGTISSGCVSVGDALAIEPGAMAVRVRGLHNHDQSVTELHRGQRGAIKLGGVHHDQITRGQELCTPGFLVPSRTLTARLRLLSDAPPLKNRSRVRLHVGTAEILATVTLPGLGGEQALLDEPAVPPNCLAGGESAIVQLHLAEPAVTVWNQPFVIRRESPLQTLGGGRILDPAPERIRRLDAETSRQLERLESSSPAERASASLYLAGLRGWEIAALPRLAGAFDAEGIRKKLLDQKELVELPLSAAKVLRVHTRVLAKLVEQVAKLLATLHEKQPLRRAVPMTELLARLPNVEPMLLDAAVKRLQTAGRLTIGVDGLTLAGQGPHLSKSEQQLLDQLLLWFRAGGINSPSASECITRAAKNKDAVRPLLALATSTEHLVAVAADYWLHADVEKEAREKVAAAIKARGPLTVSQIRELLGTTRKYAVPLCEYWDRVGFTERKGDQRWLKLGGKL
jgi:selenocysteine-specific elongation factor